MYLSIVIRLKIAMSTTKQQEHAKVAFTLTMFTFVNTNKTSYLLEWYILTFDVANSVQYCCFVVLTTLCVIIVVGTLG